MLKTEQIGRIGKIDDKGKLIVLSIVTNQLQKKDGEWEEVAVWKNHKVFSEYLQTKLERFTKGDLIYIESKEVFNSYEKEGEEIKTTQLIAGFIERIKKSSSKNSSSGKSELPF